MTRLLSRWLLPLTATAFVACAGDNFAPNGGAPAGSGGTTSTGGTGGTTGGGGNAPLAGAGGSQSGTGGSAGGGGSGPAGTGGAGGDAGSAGEGASAGSAGAEAGGNAGEGGASAGKGGTSSGSGGTSSGGGGTGGTSAGTGGTSAGTGGTSAGTGGTSAGTGGTTAGGGGSGAAGGGAGASGAAGSGGCNADNDCPAPSSVCALPFCDLGVCKELGNPSASPAQVKGNCRREVCSPDGPGTGVVDDATDLPASLGDCDVPRCVSGVAKHRSDLLACGGLSACVAGKCDGSCKGCPNGSIGLAPKGQTVCYLPPLGTETIPVSIDGMSADKAADGNVATYWNAGRNGTSGPELPPRLSIGFPEQKMSVVYLSVTVEPAVGSDGNSNIQYKLEVTDPDGQIVTFSAELASGKTGDGRVVFDLGKQYKVNNLAIVGQSDNSWITVNEVYYRNCP